MPRKLIFDPRKMMEMTIDAMRQSVHEPRTDGKASPLVGAAIYKPDGTIATKIPTMRRDRRRNSSFKCESRQEFRQNVGITVIVVSINTIRDTQ